MGSGGVTQADTNTQSTLDHTHTDKDTSIKILDLNVQDAGLQETFQY